MNFTIYLLCFETKLYTSMTLKKSHFCSIFIFVIIMSSCAKTAHLRNIPTSKFAYSDSTKKVDYSNLNNWAAHPNKEDTADLVPNEATLADQSNLPIDVFFIHPTTYWNDKEFTDWNAPINSEKLNKKTDETTIKYQASIFNKVGRVFAPRYRQAHVHVYFTKDTVSKKQALNFAYKDVEDAFEYYLKNYNNGRPFIIASHSQGTDHAGPLMKKFIDGKPLQKQMIAAYVVGLPVPVNYFEHIKPCDNAEETECMVSWRTFKKGSTPQARWNVDYQALNTNPLSWEIDGKFADKSLNKGGIMKNFNKKLPNLVDAQAYDNFLWTSKPKFPFSFLLRENNYHIIDFNLFYYNIQENAQLRTKKYFENQIK